MKKVISIALILIGAFTVAGCAKKTASEQLQDDMKKMNSDMKKEASAWK